MTSPDKQKPNKEVKIFFISTDPVTPVIESQVLDTVLLLRKEGISADVIFLLQTQHYLKSISTNKQKLSKVRTFSKVWLLPSQNNPIIKTFAALLLAWIAFIQKKPKIIFHCRGLRSTDLAIRASKLTKKIRVICDIRGDLLAEAEYSSKPKELINQIAALEEKCIKQSDYTLYVSEYLRETIVKRHNHTLDHSSVMYCTANHDKVFNKKHRDNIRHQFGIKDELVFIYTGSIGRWHCFDAVISISEVIAQIYSNVKFIFLVNQQNEAKAIITNSRLANYTEVLSVGSEEVGAYLSAADVAFLIREPHPLNTAASPVKFAEYVINGLPVIMTDAINDYADIIRNSGNGIVLDSYQYLEIPHLNTVFTELPRENWFKMRNKYQTEITNKLSKEHYIQNIQGIYVDNV